MVFASILDRFSKPRQEVPSAAPPPPPKRAVPLPGAFTYPPADPGIPFCDPSDIVKAAAPKLQRLRELTVSDAANFEPAYLDPIRKLADLVNLLPASASEHYSAPGGLFHLCLDVAYYSLQSADGKVFTPNGTVEHTHRDEPRWRYATFLAGLACQVFRSLTLMTVTNERGEQWPRFSVPLSDWLTQTGSDRFFVNWHAAANITGGEGASVLAAIAPKARLDWLAQADVQIVRDMNQVALGASHKADSIMARVVAEIVERVLSVDKATQRTRYGRLTVGSLLEPYVLDAFRRLLECGRWAVNRNGPLWYGTDALYLEWPAAYPEVEDLFVESGWRGMPRSPVTLAEVLGKAGVLDQHDESALWVWKIRVPTANGDLRDATALRFKEPLPVLGYSDIQPAPQHFDARLVHAQQQAAALVSGSAALPSNRGTAAPAQATQPSGAPAPLPAEPAGTPPAAQSPAETVAPVEQDDGERTYASLIKQEVRRFIASDDVAEVLGQVLALHRQHRGDVVKVMPYGVAIRLDWIQDNSGVVSDLQILKVLEKNRWLGRPPSEKNERNKIHNVQFDDKPGKAIVLNDFGAKQLGFEIKGRP